jgi:hypothetical protein
MLEGGGVGDVSGGSVGLGSGEPGSGEPEGEPENEGIGVDEPGAGLASAVITGAVGGVGPVAVPGGRDANSPK